MPVVPPSSTLFASIYSQASQQRSQQRGGQHYPTEPTSAGIDAFNQRVELVLERRKHNHLFRACACNKYKTLAASQLKKRKQPAEDEVVKDISNTSNQMSYPAANAAANAAYSSSMEDSSDDDDINTPLPSTASSFVVHPVLHSLIPSASSALLALAAHSAPLAPPMTTSTSNTFQHYGGLRPTGGLYDDFKCQNPGAHKALDTRGKLCSLVVLGAVCAFCLLDLFYLICWF